MSNRANWPTILLKDLQAPKKYALNGGPFGSKLVRRDYVPSGVPVIRGTNLSDDSRFDLEGFVFVSEEKADELLPNNAHPGDLVFTQRGTLGQVGIIPKGCGYDRFVISQSQMKLSVDESKANPYFLYYYFRAPETVHTIRSLAISSGVPHINLDILRHFEVRLPPLPTQRKIAAVLSTYDDLIENNTRRIAVLEQMAQLLYCEWFVHFRFPGREQVATVDVSSEQLGANGGVGPKIEAIPGGWELKQLGDIAEEVRRSVKPEAVPPETPYIGLGHMPKKSIALSEWGTTKETRSTKLIFRRGEILFGKIRPYFHKVGVAPVDGVCSTDAIVIVSRAPKYYALTLAYVSSEQFVEYATLTSQGTKMPRANWRVLVKYPVLIPPAPILSRFNTMIEDIVAQIHKMIFRNITLRRTRDLLLPRLISGQLDVADLDIDAGGLDD